MNKEIKERIETINKGEVPDGYKKEKWQLFPEDWCKPSLLNTVLIENKERNENLVYGIDDVLSVYFLKYSLLDLSQYQCPCGDKPV